VRDDRQLAFDAQHGDRRAFSELVTRHQSTIYRVCFRILFDAEDAADATQEAFIRAFRSIDTFNHQSAFKTWMVRIAVNVSLNVKSRQRDGIPLEDMHLEAAPSAESVVMRAQEIERLYRTLQLLPPNHRASVVLRDLEGFSYQEIALTLDVPEGTAKGWVHRGRERLKDLLT
jgi:RNA polymerase sigma-70 factor, ECF subfamily